MTRVTKEITCQAYPYTFLKKYFIILLKNLNLIFLINRGIPCAKFVHNVGQTFHQQISITDELKSYKNQFWNSRGRRSGKGGGEGRSRSKLYEWLNLWLMSCDREDTACKRCHAYVCEQREIVYLKTIASTSRVGGLTYTCFITIMPSTNAGHAYYILKIATEYYAVFGRMKRKVNRVRRRSRLLVSSVCHRCNSCKIYMFPDIFTLKISYRAAYY